MKYRRPYGISLWKHISNSVLFAPDSSVPSLSVARSCCLLPGFVHHGRTLWIACAR